MRRWSREMAARGWYRAEDIVRTSLPVDFSRRSLEAMQGCCSRLCDGHLMTVEELEELTLTDWLNANPWMYQAVVGAIMAPIMAHMAHKMIERRA